MTHREQALECPLKLGEMRVGEGGLISRLDGPEDLVRRLMELGLVEDSYVQIAHQAPFGGDPIAVKVRGGLLGLRKSEANRVWVRRNGHP